MKTNKLNWPKLQVDFHNCELPRIEKVRQPRQVSAWQDAAWYFVINSKWRGSVRQSVLERVSALENESCRLGLNVPPPTNKPKPRVRPPANSKKTRSAGQEGDAA